MILIKTLSFLLMLLLFLPLTAKDGTSVLKLCFFHNNEPFIVSTEEEVEAEKLGFNKYRDSNRFLRKMKVLINGSQTNFFKPLDDNCITVYRIPSGRQEVTVELKSVSYTAMEPREPVSVNFRPKRLHEGRLEIIEGPVAKVKISQMSNNVSVYQALDNKPVENCEKECNVPTGIPIYFKLKSLDEKTKCPVRYELVLQSENEKNMGCYDNSKIKKMLVDYVDKNNVECRVNIEYAFFRVFGEGCLVMMESGKDGLRPKRPEIKMIPLEKQKYVYFWKTRKAEDAETSEKVPYNFTGDRKGQEKIPVEGEVIEFFEERNL